MGPAAVLHVMATANTTQAQAAFKSLDTQMKATTATANKTTAAMSATVARGAARAAGAIGLVGGASIVAAAKYESAFAEVRKTVDATEPQFKRLEKGILNLSTRIPMAATELAELAGQAGALGIKQKDLLKFTRTAAELGISTDLSAEQAANALARLSNIMGTSAKDFRRLGSTLVELGNSGASTEAEIAEMALRISGAGKQVGLSEARVLSFASALSSVGVRAESGGSAISRVFIEMANSVASADENLEGFARVAGMQVPAFSKLFEQDAAMATLKFIEGLDGIRKAGGNVFAVLEELGLNEIRVRDALLRASGAGKLFREQLAIGNREWKDNNALTKEANRRYATTAAQFEILKNKAFKVGVEFGNRLLPKVNEIMDRLGKGDLSGAIQAFGELGAKCAVAFGKGFMEAWLDMGVLGKLFTAAVLIRVIGGRGALATAGKAIGALLIGRIGAGMATGAGAGALATGLKFAMTRAIPIVGWGLLGGQILDELFGQDTLDKKMARVHRDMADGWQQIAKSRKLFTGTQREAAREYIQNMVKMGTVTEEQGRRMQAALNLTQNARMWKSFSRFLNIAGGDMVRFTGVTQRQMREVQKLLTMHPERGRKALAKTFDKAVTNVQRAMDRTEISTKRGMDLIVELLSAKLEMFGIRGGIRGITRRSLSGGLKDVPVLKDQRGGIIPGTGDGDKIRVLAEPGEGFINKRAVQALGGPAAINAINSMFPRFQSGGNVEGPEKVTRWQRKRPPNVGGFPTFSANYLAGLPSAQALNVTATAAALALKRAKGGSFSSIGDIVTLGRALQRQGFAVGEHPAFGGVAPVHTANSWHYKARALDVNADTMSGGEMENLDRLNAQLRRNKNVIELLWRVPDHYDHLHVAMQRGGIVGDFARAGADTKASKKAMFALFMAGLAESGMRDLGYGDSTSEGVLQLLSSTARNYGINPHNEYAVAKGFLTHGYWGKGGANRLSRSVGSAAMIAHLVQGNATGTSVYSAQAGEAQRLLRGSGLRFPNDRATLVGGAAAGGGRRTPPIKRKLLRKIAKLSTAKGLAYAISPKLDARIKTLSADADRFEEWASRAEQLGANVYGKGELGWLMDELAALWSLRNALVRAYQIVTAKRARAQKLLRQIKDPRAKTKVRGEMGKLTTQQGGIREALNDVQGVVTTGGAFKLYPGGKMPTTLGLFGGRIFDTQMRLKELGAATGAQDSPTGLTTQQLAEIGYLRGLGVRFNPSQFAGFFAKGGMLRRGEWGIAGERGPEPVFGPATVLPSGASPEIRVVLQDQRTAIYRNGDLVREVVHGVLDDRDRAQARSLRAGRLAR